jgi:hypothetical protein
MVYLFMRVQIVRLPRLHAELHTGGPQDFRWHDFMEFGSSHKRIAIGLLRSAVPFDRCIDRIDRSRGRQGGCGHRSGNGTAGSH